jgi:hypothetical protein
MKIYCEIENFDDGKGYFEYGIKNNPNDEKYCRSEASLVNGIIGGIKLYGNVPQPLDENMVTYVGCDGEYFKSEDIPYWSCE